MVGDRERFGRIKWRAKAVYHILETHIQADNQEIDGQTRPLRSYLTKLCVDRAIQLYIEASGKAFAASVDAIESDEYSKHRMDGTDTCRGVFRGIGY